MQHQVVAATCGCKRVELDRAEPPKDLEHRVGPSFERPRRREQLARYEKAASVVGADLQDVVNLGRLQPLVGAVDENDARDDDRDPARKDGPPAVSPALQVRLER
jgi:hypothetical protein